MEPRRDVSRIGWCMARPKELRDPTVLLCERCGYDLTGTPRESACGECGIAVKESLPERRMGTPFQKKPGVMSFVYTMWLVARRPRAVWDDVRIESNRSLVFGVVCMTIAGLVIWAGLGFTSIGKDLRSAYFAFALLFVIFTSLVIMTTIEFLGLQLIGRKNGWRVTSRISQTVCGHACVGWIVAGVLVAIGWQLGARLPAAPLTNQVPNWMNPILTSLQFTLPAAGFFIGMMVFETLAYMGVRRLRWGNG